MIYEHNLNPIVIEIFSLKIYWYSLAYIFGFLFCLHYSKFLIRKKILKVNHEILENFITWSILAVLLGGRIGYVIFYNIEFYLEFPSEIIKVWKGGMSFHGGLIGIIILMILFSKVKKIDFKVIANLVCYTCPFGIFLGRIANFINAELIGKPTNGSWGVVYKNETFPRHPSQIYEAIFEGLLIFLILYFFSRSKLINKFNVYAIFLVLYGLFRFNLEFFREPDSHLGYIIYGLSMGQILSIPMFVFGIIFLTYGKKKQNL